MDASACPDPGHDRKRLALVRNGIRTLDRKELQLFRHSRRFRRWLHDNRGIICGYPRIHLPGDSPQQHERGQKDRHLWPTAHWLRLAPDDWGFGQGGLFLRKRGRSFCEVKGPQFLEAGTERGIENENGPQMGAQDLHRPGIVAWQPTLRSQGRRQVVGIPQETHVPRLRFTAPSPRETLPASGREYGAAARTLETRAIRESVSRSSSPPIPNDAHPGPIPIPSPRRESAHSSTMREPLARSSRTLSTDPSMDVSNARLASSVSEPDASFEARRWAKSISSAVPGCFCQTPSPARPNKTEKVQSLCHPLRSVGNVHMGKNDLAEASRGPPGFSGAFGNGMS